ncbi:MAG: LysE family transporter [Dysgonamonadaceae bacterium]|jgi:threonine/homoserine/homoserine lactone efflux protein|nr:LysE family transporter [Dysgonamonadaceae bacterium]
MIGILYKGFIIGVLVSAPMGPIGLLCIQRTLNKGRWHGFFSGVGATMSDIIYATITCLGMGFVIDFVEHNQSILQIIGSLLLLIFGYYIYHSNPSKSLRKQSESGNVTYHQDIATSFLLTLSNPFIIFLFIALFARFNFISVEEKLFSMILGLCAVALGALSWWFLITTLIGKLRKNFNLRGLWIMNRIVGITVMVLSIVGIIFFISAPA